MITLAVMVLAGCGGSAITGVDELSGTDGKVTVQYLICGTTEGVSMAFCSQMGPLDTIPVAVLPILIEFELDPGTEAFMRAHKLGDGVITVLVIANGFVNATDTALEGDRTAEARIEVW